MMFLKTIIIAALW